MITPVTAAASTAYTLGEKTSGRKTMRRRDVLRGSAALAGALTLAGGPPIPAFAQASMTLKVSDVHAPGYPTVAAVESLGKKLKQATNGRLTVQMFGSMQLGGEKEAIEQAQVGALQMARVSVGAIGPVIDDLNVFNLPFLFRNTAHMQNVIDGAIGTELLDKVTRTKKPASSDCAGWMPARAASTTPSIRSNRSPI